MIFEGEPNPGLFVIRPCYFKSETTVFCLLWTVFRE